MQENYENESVKKIVDFLQGLIDKTYFEQFKIFRKELEKIEMEYRNQFIENCALSDDPDKYLEEFKERCSLLGTFSDIFWAKLKFVKNNAKSYYDSNDKAFQLCVEDYYNQNIRSLLDRMAKRVYKKQESKVNNALYNKLYDIKKIIGMINDCRLISHEQLERVRSFINDYITSEEALTAEPTIQDVKEFYNWLTTMTNKAYFKSLAIKRQKEVAAETEELESEIEESIEEQVFTGLDSLNEEQRRIADEIINLSFHPGIVNKSKTLPLINILKEKHTIESLEDSKEWFEDSYSANDIVYMMRELLSNDILDSNNAIVIMEIIASLYKRFQTINNYDEDHKEEIIAIENLIDSHHLRRNFEVYVNGLKAQVDFSGVLNAYEFRDKFYDGTGIIEETINSLGNSRYKMFDYFEYLCEEEIEALYLEYKEESNYKERDNILEQISEYMDVIEEIKRDNEAEIEAAKGASELPKVSGEDEIDISKDVRHFIFLTDRDSKIVAYEMLLAEGVDLNQLKQFAFDAINDDFRSKMTLCRNETITSAVKVAKYRHKIWAFRRSDIRTGYINIKDFLDEDIAEYLSDGNKGFYIVVGQILKKGNTRVNDPYDDIGCQSNCNLISEFIEQINQKLREIISKYKTPEEKEEAVKKFFDDMEVQQIKQFTELLNVGGRK